jgi:hypothetical protein
MDRLPPLGLWILVPPIHFLDSSSRNSFALTPLPEAGQEIDDGSWLFAGWETAGAKPRLPPGIQLPSNERSPISL